MRRALAAGAAVLVLTGCTAPQPDPEPSGSRAQLELTIGALLPASGAIERFGPATRAAVQLAADDVNAAGLPVTVAAETRDAGDSASETGVTSTTELLALPVDAIVGPLSDGVAKKVVDLVVDAGVPMISPGNTAPDLSEQADDGLYWRTTPPCTFEADVLAAEVADSGAGTAALLAAVGPCGPDLTDAVRAALQRLGVEVVDEVDLAATAADAAATAAAQADAEAVVVVSAAARDAIAPLLAAGFTGPQLFLLGLAPGDYSADFPAGALGGATVTSPGPDLSALDDFARRLTELDPGITDISYAPETYDAVVLLALAALAADGTDGEAIAGSLRAVSGGGGDGEACDDIASCGRIVLRGGVPDYEGLSGPITFDEAGDPLGAIIGVFRADETGVFRRVD